MHHLKKFFAACFVLLIITGLEKGITQESRHSPDALRTLAAGAFDSANYHSAARYYESLLALFPKDPAYHYYLGISLIRGNIDPERGIGLLKFPQVQEFFSDALYWQGEGYRLLYRLAEAILLYEACMNDRQAPAAVKKKAEAAKAWAISAKNKVQYPVKVKVFKETSLGSGPPWPPVISVTGDTFLVVSPPETFVQRYTLKELPPVWLVPSNPPNNCRLVFSIPARWPRKNEIWESIYHNYSGWGSFQPSTGNNLPPVEFVAAIYWPPDSGWYFSSTVSSIGQQDIFFIQKSSGTVQSDFPGFPLNSASDEVAFIPDKTHNLAILISNRKSGGRFLTAYEISWPVKPMETSSAGKEPLALVFFPERTAYTQPDLPASNSKNVNGEGKKSGNGRIRNQSSSPPVAMTSEDQSGYLTLLNEALRLQLKADSMMRAAEEQKQKLASIKDPTERTYLSRRIASMFSSADSLQNLANIRYSLAREMEMKYLQKEIPRYRPPAKNQTGNTQERQESSKQPNTVRTEPIKQYDSLVVKKQVAAEPQPIAASGKTNGKNDVFEIRTTPGYSERNPIPVNQELPEGVIYRIQIGAFSKPAKPEMFRGLYPVYAEKVSETGIIRYYTGDFFTIGGAEKALKKVKEYGFPEAFIVSWFQGKRISLIRARELEQMISNP